MWGYAIKKKKLSASLIPWILIFLSSCDYIKVRAKLGALLSLHGTNSEVSMTSIASFAANTNTEAAYKQFCKDLYRIGATEDMVWENKDKILAILRSQDMVASSRIGGSGDQYQEQDHEQEQVLEMAYKEFCENLHQIGLTEDMMLPKDKILEMLRSRGMVSQG